MAVLHPRWNGLFSESRRDAARWRLGHDRCDEVLSRKQWPGKRSMNQFFFERLLIVEGHVEGAVLQEPFGTLVREDLLEKLRADRTQTRIVQAQV
jgi:hypothetical protein